MKILLILVLFSYIFAEEICRFAKKYTLEQFKTNPDVVDQFLKEAIHWEAKFIKELAIDQKSGMTLDGQQLDIETGLPFGKPHLFSAPSKESIHFAILALSLAKNSYAQIIYTVEEAFDIIKKKIVSIEKFNNEFPGYGGFIPWVSVIDGDLKPIDNWDKQVPALDCGEYFWGVYSLVSVLESMYPHETELISQYQNVWQRMARNSVKIFYEGNGKIRAVASIEDIKKSVEENTYTNQAGDYFLDDPYEGELFAWIMHLFGTWQDPSEREKIWVDKRKKSVNVEYWIEQLHQSVTVQKGFWFSAHEQWKYLFMPYSLSKKGKQLLENAEKVRTWDANIKKRPGMLASVTANITYNGSPEYWSDCGIPEISFQPVTHDFLVTPYSTMALFLVNKQVGAAWYWNMISGPAGQNQFGSTEALSIFGESVSPVVTWDSKITTVVGMMGGVGSLTGRKLFHDGKLFEFKRILDRELDLTFETIKGKEVEFAYPETQIKQNREDFTSCHATKKEQTK